MIVDENEVARRLKQLARGLESKGVLEDPEWRRAFLAVHRHVFVPRFWRDEDPGAFPARWRMIDNATADHTEWLDTVYSDATLATELTGVPVTGSPGTRHPQVTSSTTMPSLVMTMLDALEVRDGMDVLEIGTGTGYNAALLCERLGSEHVITVDISPELVALARVRLAAHGYTPHVLDTDGASVSSGNWDRIIATCGLDHVPAQWIKHTREGGKILLNLLGPWNPFALLLLTVEGGVASGRFLAGTGGFMPRRTAPDRPFDYAARIPRAASTEPVERFTSVDPANLYENPAFGLLGQTTLGRAKSRQVYADDDAQQLTTEIVTEDGSSWAVVHHDHGDDGFRVDQAGPRHLWDEIEAVYQQWTSRDRPAVHHYGLTIDGDDTTLWLDNPDDAQPR